MYVIHVSLVRFKANLQLYGSGLGSALGADTCCFAPLSVFCRTYLGVLGSNPRQEHRRSYESQGFMDDSCCVGKLLQVLIFGLPGALIYFLLQLLLHFWVRCEHVNALCNCHCSGLISSQHEQARLGCYLPACTSLLSSLSGSESAELCKVITHRAAGVDQ